MNNLVKVKYGMKNIKITMKNLYERDHNDYDSLDSKDCQIIDILKLLKSFTDLYKSHKNNNKIINYQIISNILKHTNFEILRIEDNKRYTNNINIFFKIDLSPDKINDKKFKIISFKKIISSYYNDIEILKMKLIGDEIYFFAVHSWSESIINVYQDFKETKNKISLNDKIKNFIVLENGDLVIYLTCKLLIYKFSKDIFNLEKEIDLDNNKNCFAVLKHLCQNNFALLIHDKDKKTISLKVYVYPNYKGKNILLQKNQFQPIYGTAYQTYKWFIIAIDYYVNNLYKIFIIDVAAKKIKDITMKKRETYYNTVKIFELDFNKILISFQRYVLIINLEVMQIETKIKIGAMECLNQIGDYFLASSDDYIYQFDIKKGKKFNKIKLLYGAYDFTFIDLIDIGDNYFCAVSQKKNLFLFKYE